MEWGCCLGQHSRLYFGWEIFDFFERIILLRGKKRPIRVLMGRDMKYMKRKEISAVNSIPYTPVEDEDILKLYFARDERAIAETDRRHGKTCMQVSVGILHSRPDAEECVNDTYLRVWNAIPPTRPQSLRAYLCRIVRNLSINRLRAMSAAKRHRDLTLSLSELDACIPAPAGDEPAGGSTEELARLISDFLRTVDATDRRLFMGRYFYARSVPELAADTALGEKAVYKHLEKTRTRLQAYLTERGYTV